MAMGHHPQLGLLSATGPAPQPHRRAEGAALAEAEQGLEATPQCPGRPRHTAELEAQGQLPTGGMGPGGRPQLANRRGAVVAGRGAAVGAGEIEGAIAGHRLQRQGQQGGGAAKGVEIHQLKALLPLQTSSQQVLGREGSAAQSRLASQIRLEQG